MAAMEAAQQMLGTVSQAFESADSKRLAVGAACAAPVALVAYGSVRRWLRSRRFPPGPAGLPILGCVQLNDISQWHIELEKLGEKYNGLFSFYFGTQLMVVVTEYEMMKEMLEGPNFAGRHTSPLTKKVVGEGGIAISEGASWSHHRRLSLRILRDFGFAKDSSFEMLMVAMESVFNSIDESIERGQPTKKLLQHFLNVTNSVIAQLTFGRLFTRDDPDFAEFCDAVAQLFEHPLLSVLDKYPVLAHILAAMPIDFKKGTAVMNAFAAAAVREREAALVDEFMEPTCLCDVYIQERRKAEKKGDFGTYKEEKITGVCSDFFIAGTDTTARTVEWIILMMAFYPDVQQKVQQELDDLVGRSGQLELSHKSKTHYTNAVIEECYRKAPIGALGLFHRTTEDTEFHGYLIPKDSLILPFQYSVLRSEKNWDQPELFRPERFLDSNGCFKGSPRVIPFLMGKRACVGEALARMEVFGMFSSIMQRYSVRPTASSLARRDEVLTPILRLALEPGDYELEFTRR